MKFTIILLIVVAASVCAAEDAPKSKRGLSLGLGYHAPLVSHSAYVAPAVVHSSSSIVHHAPAYYAHSAPLIAHAPIAVAHHPVAYHHLPAIHSYHHFRK